jgi:geranylgeranyl reductase family protein
MIDRMEKFDCVICGAGPAGSTAAKYLAESGLRVAVLDKDTYPRDKPCGGGLRPSIVDEFEHVREGLSRIPHTVCKRAIMYPPSLKNHVDYRPGKAVLYNIQRKHFDNLLLDYAKDANAIVFEGEHVKDVVPKSEGYVLRTKSGMEVEGKMVIGAGGMHDPVARYMRIKEGLPEKWPKSEIGLAVVKEYTVDDSFILDRYGEERTCHFHLKPNNLYGYAWTFSKENAINIGFGAFWKYMKEIDIKEQFSYYLNYLKKEKLVPRDLEIGHPKGAPIPLRGAIKTTYSDNMILVGDAAGFVSPIGGDGIYFSLDSARIAANVVKYASENDSFRKETLARYQEEWQARWGKDLETLCYFADKIFKSTEKIMNYACKDDVFKKMAVSLYTGDQKATDLKFKIQRRVARDFLLYDVLKIN